MGSFTQQGSAHEPSDEEGSVDNWNSFGPAANRVFDTNLAKPAQVGRDDQSIALLARAIQDEIIPRLMLAHRTPSLCMTTPPFAPSKVVTADVEHFVKAILSQNETMALGCIDSVRSRGASLESLYLDLLAPAARHLGKLWEDDLCNFTEVTIGLGHLQQLLHGIKPDIVEPPAANGLSILLLCTPGEQHTFGLSMVAEFFRREGWDVTGGPHASPGDPAALVRQKHFDVVGLSLATERHIEQLGDCIRSMRKSSINPRLCIMVGGPVFTMYPEYASKVHADLVSSEGSAAPGVAQRFVETRVGSETKH